MHLFGTVVAVVVVVMTKAVDVTAFSADDQEIYLNLTCYPGFEIEEMQTLSAKCKMTVKEFKKEHKWHTPCFPACVVLSMTDLYLEYGYIYINRSPVQSLNRFFGLNSPKRETLGEAEIETRTKSRRKLSNKMHKCLESAPTYYNYAFPCEYWEKFHACFEAAFKCTDETPKELFGDVEVGKGKTRAADKDEERRKAEAEEKRKAEEERRKAEAEERRKAEEDEERRRAEEDDDDLKAGRGDAIPDTDSDENSEEIASIPYVPQYSPGALGILWGLQKIYRGALDIKGYAQMFIDYNLGKFISGWKGGRWNIEILNEAMRTLNYDSVTFLKDVRLFKEKASNMKSKSAKANLELFCERVKVLQKHIEEFRNNVKVFGRAVQLYKDKGAGIPEIMNEIGKGVKTLKEDVMDGKQLINTLLGKAEPEQKKGAEQKKSNYKMNSIKNE